MEQVICKKCTSLDCRGCNLLRLEQMLKSGKLNALMDEKHGIKTEIDVRPVVRGKWIEHGEPNAQGQYEAWYYYCSLCGQVGIKQYNYCPNCGARMVTDDD